MAKSAEIGSLRVSLGLDSAQFSAGASQAQSTLSKLSGAFKAFAAGAVAALSLNKMEEAFLAITERLDDMGKSAQKIGIPVEELSKLSYAAKLADVPMEALQTSIGKLSKGLAQFQATGKGDAGNALRAIGVAAVDTTGKLRPTSAIIQDIAGKFAQYEDGANKTALAIALFGKSGADMIPLLNAGKQGLADAASEAERFGVVVSKDASASAEVFNDNLTKLQTAGQGLAQVIAVPVVEALANFTTQLAAYVDIGSHASDITNAVREQMAKLGDVFRTDAADLQKFSVIWDTLKNIANGTTGPLGALGAWRAMGAEIEKINVDLTKQNELARQTVNLVGKGSLPTTATKPQAPNFNTVAETDRIAELRRKKAAADAKHMLSEAMSSYDSSRGAIEKYKDEIKNLDFLLAKGQITQGQYNEHVKNLRAAFESSSQAAETFAHQLGTTLEGTFQDWVSKALDGTFKLRDALKGLLAQITQMFANKAITGIISGLLDGHPLYGGGVGASGIGSVIPKLFGFASGGTIFPGGSGGIDSQLVAFRKSPNERVDITKPGQRLTGGSSNVTIIDQRHNAPQVERQKGPDGSMRILIKDQVNSMLGTGELDPGMGRYVGGRSNRRRS